MRIRHRTRCSLKQQCRKIGLSDVGVEERQAHSMCKYKVDFSAAFNDDANDDLSDDATETLSDDAAETLNGDANETLSDDATESLNDDATANGRMGRESER